MQINTGEKITRNNHAETVKIVLSSSDAPFRVRQIYYSSFMVVFFSELIDMYFKRKHRREEDKKKA